MKSFSFYRTSFASFVSILLVFVSIMGGLYAQNEIPDDYPIANPCDREGGPFILQRCANEETPILLDPTTMELDSAPTSTFIVLITPLPLGTAQSTEYWGTGPQNAFNLLDIDNLFTLNFGPIPTFGPGEYEIVVGGTVCNFLWYDTQTLTILPVDVECFDEGGSGQNRVSAPTTGIYPYPNPASDKLNIRYELETANTELEIVNLTGQLLHQQTLTTSNGIIKVDTKDMAAGVYFIRLFQAGKIRHTQKLMITP